MGHKSGSCSTLDAPMGVLLVHLSQSYNAPYIHALATAGVRVIVGYL